MVAKKHLFGPAVAVVARRHLLGSMRRTWREAQLASAQIPTGLLFVAEVAAGCEVVGAVGAGGGRWLGSGVLSPACFLHHTHTLTGQMASPASPATAMTMAMTIAYGNDPATRQGGRSNGGHPALRQRQADPRDCPTAPSRRGPVGHQSGPGLEAPSPRHRPHIPRLCPIVLGLCVRPDPAQHYPTPQRIQRTTCENTGLQLCPRKQMQPQPLGSVQRGPYYHIAGGLATSISLFARVCV